MRSAKKSIDLDSLPSPAMEPLPPLSGRTRFRCFCGEERIGKVPELHGESICRCQGFTSPLPERDLRGLAFGKLSVTGWIGTTRLSMLQHWRCTCTCKTVVEVAEPLLLSGRRVSCGCQGDKQDSRGTAEADARPARSRGRPRTSKASSAASKERSSVGTGLRYGDLIVIRAMSRPQFWLWQCDCGQEVAVHEDMLLSGGARSCAGAKAHPVDPPAAASSMSEESAPPRTRRAHLSVVS